MPEFVAHDSSALPLAAKMFMAINFLKKEEVTKTTKKKRGKGGEIKRRTERQRREMGVGGKKD